MLGLRSVVATVRNAWRPQAASGNDLGAFDWKKLAEQYSDPVPVPVERLEAAKAAIREFIPKAEAHGGQHYLEVHLERLAMTLAMMPPPFRTSRILELGCYMQMTPYLKRFAGYEDVRGAYFGPAGKTERKAIAFPDGYFTCFLDKFDAEKDPFPYPDDHFDAILAGEVIEHFLSDPMHMLLECRRTLVERGSLIVTTPNAGCISTVARALYGENNPQNWAQYAKPKLNEAPEVGHMREYTAAELPKALTAAGFEVKRLFTVFDPQYESHLRFLPPLEANDYPTRLRGQQIYCEAVKNSALPVDRYPYFLYD